MRFSDAQTARARQETPAEKRRRLGRLYTSSLRDLQAIAWRDHRGYGLVRRKEGIGWAGGLQRTPHSPAPVDGPWRYVLGGPDGSLRRFDPPSPPALNIPECPTISRTKFPGLYKPQRFGEGESKVVLVSGSWRPGFKPPMERQMAKEARSALRWHPGPYKLPEKPIYAQRPWRVRLAAPDTPDTTITLRFEPHPMARADVPVLMRDELGAGFHVIRPIGLQHPWIIRQPGERAIYSTEAWSVLWGLWHATLKPPYLRQIWCLEGPAGKLVHHRILGEIFDADPSGAIEERFLGRNTTGTDKEEYSPHGDRPFRPGLLLRLWERARAEESTRRTDYLRWLPVIRRALRQERLDHGHIAEQRRLANLRALFREHELLVHSNLLAYTEPYRRYTQRGGARDIDLERWIEAISRRVRFRWGAPLRRRRHEYDIEDLMQEGWVAALKAQRGFDPDRGTWKAYSALAISRALWSWLRWQASPVTISLNRRTYKKDRTRGIIRDPIEFDAEIRDEEGILVGTPHDFLSEDEHVDQDAPNWRETAALLGGVDGAKKRARMALDGFELAIMLARLEGAPVRRLAEQMNMPVWKVYELQARAVERILRKMDPTMTQVWLRPT